jgi:ADP-ribosylglycohydrolase
MLCLAGGDSAGGSSAGGYSSITQQAVILAYHLLRLGSIDRELLADELAELDGAHDGLSVFRSTSDDLRRWLDSVGEGELVLSAEPSAEPAARVAPVGMWFRRDPDALTVAALETSRLTHLDGPTAVAATAAAGAVAASCFAQNGRDLLLAVAEVASQAADAISNQDFRYARLDSIPDTLERFWRMARLIGEPADVIADEIGRDPVGLVVAGIALAAPPTDRPHELVEEGARIGGSAVGALVGAMIGARTGIRLWPWAIPNDSWFVALGQRLASREADLTDLPSGEARLTDLPVPYAVEQRLTYAGDHRHI